MRAVIMILLFASTASADPNHETFFGSHVRALRTASANALTDDSLSGPVFGYGYRLLIAEHAVFSVIGPEGAAAILERDPTRAPVVADRLALTSADMRRLGIVDEVVAEGQEALDAAVAAALDAAQVGEREARFDAATARWLEP